MSAVRRMATAAVIAATYAVAIRPRMLHSGATQDEVEGPYPGADLVPGGTRGATMATTIDAPPSQVWPWLVQMGNSRGGWYSWDHLDNHGAPSADRIHPEWQDIKVGDRIPSTPDGSHWFEVAALEPERFLALRASFDFRGRQFPATSRRPASFTDSSWCFQLKELPGGRTRLVVSGYAAVRPTFMLAGGYLFWEPAHWIMQRRQFTNLKRRTERGPHRGPEAAPQPSASVHRPTYASR